MVKYLFLAIRPMVDQIAPAMEKLNQNRFHAEAGKLEVLVQNEKRITELCSLHKINFEKSEAIGGCIFAADSTLNFHFRQKYGNSSSALQCSH